MTDQKKKKNGEPSKVSLTMRFPIEEKSEVKLGKYGTKEVKCT